MLTFFCILLISLQTAVELVPLDNFCKAYRSESNVYVAQQYCFQLNLVCCGSCYNRSCCQISNFAQNECVNTIQRDYSNPDTGFIVGVVLIFGSLIGYLITFCLKKGKTFILPKIRVHFKKTQNNQQAIQIQSIEPQVSHTTSVTITRNTSEPSYIGQNDDAPPSYEDCTKFANKTVKNN